MHRRHSFEIDGWSGVAMAGAMMALAACATTSDSAWDDPQRAAARVAQLSVFEPKPDGRKVKINYDPMDQVLDRIVLRTGPSLRQPAGIPRPFTGTRLVYGHLSKLRLEGNKVFFSVLQEEQKAVIHEITDGLIALANRVELNRWPRDDQLAFWFNLHNMLVVSTILKNYPTIAPSKLEVGPDNLPFHDAPLVVIKGVPLSLRDIRLGIVFRYWEDPKVMYGFFHGDLASPNIRGRAYRAETLSKQLGFNAREFVNALRGVKEQMGTMLVSPLYKEARGTLLTDWPSDLRYHLRDFAGPAVVAILDETDDVSFSRYERRTADLVGGKPHLPVSAIGAGAAGPGATPASGGQPFSAYRFLFPLATPAFAFTFNEFKEKFRVLRLRPPPSAVDGSVIIEDEPFDDPTEKDLPTQQQVDDELNRPG